MDFKRIKSIVFFLGFCVTISDAKGNNWAQQNGNRWNLQNGGDDKNNARGWSPVDSQVKDGGDWNDVGNALVGRDFGPDKDGWNKNGRDWSSGDVQSKDNVWSPNDSQAKEGGTQSPGFSQSDVQVKDYGNQNAEGNQRYPGRFGAADSQSKDSEPWNDGGNRQQAFQPTDGQTKVPGNWITGRDRQIGSWRPEDAQAKNNWGQEKIDDSLNRGPPPGAWGEQNPGSWNPPRDSDAPMDWGTGPESESNQGIGGGDWSSNRSPGQDGTEPNPGPGGGDWSARPSIGPGGDSPSDQSPEQDGGPNQGTGGGDWSERPSVGQGNDWPSNQNPGQEGGPNQGTGGGDWSERPSMGQGGDWPSNPSPGLGDGAEGGPTQGGYPIGGTEPSIGQDQGDRGDIGNGGDSLFPPRVPQGNYKGGDSPHPGEADAGKGRLEDSIPGTPGVDYPNYSAVPKTGFNCKQHEHPGYYGDVEAQCQVFHICQSDGRHDSFLCPLGTIFDQRYFVCVWWFSYNCDETETHYGLNADLYKGGHGQGNFKGDPYRGGTTPEDTPSGRSDSGTVGGGDLAPPGSGQPSPQQGVQGDGVKPQEGERPDFKSPGIVEQGPGYGQSGPGSPQQGSGYGQDLPGGPQQGTGYRQNGPEGPQQGPGYGQDGPQQGPGLGQSGPGGPQQGPGYGQDGPESPQEGPGYVQPIIPLQGNEGDIQGGQGTDYGQGRGDWSQDFGGKRNWESGRGTAADGNWRGGGTAGGVKGGWKSPDGSARGRKARSWGTHDDGLEKRWGSESDASNWISLEEAGYGQGGGLQQGSGYGQRGFGGGEEEERGYFLADPERDSWTIGSKDDVRRGDHSNDLPDIRRPDDIPDNEESGVHWGSAEERAGSPESNNVEDIQRLRNWRTIDEQARRGEGSNSEDIKKNWWHGTLPREVEGDGRKGRFARDLPHLFGGWRTLGSQFDHHNAPTHRRKWNR